MSSLLSESGDGKTVPAPISRPRVSAFMSCYNAGPYLKASVESVLSQSFEDFEFVIINDGSTDESKNYLDSITDPRVRIIHRSNQGIGRPLNEAMRSCRGEFIMRLDADDICDSERMTKQLKAFESNAGLILVGCYYCCFSENGDSKVSKLPVHHKDIVGGMLSGWHTISHATIMFRRDLLDLITGYEITGAGEDWSLLLDAARYGELGMVPETLYRARVHEGSAAWQGARKVWFGFEFARRRYQRFIDGQPELTIEQFIKDWEREGFFSKLRIQRKAISSTMHRQAKLDLMGNRKLYGNCRLLLASALDPSKTIGAIWKRLVVPHP